MGFKRPLFQIQSLGPKKSFIYAAFRILKDFFCLKFHEQTATKYIPQSASLKDKRQVHRSLIEKVRHKFNAAIAFIINFMSDSNMVADMVAELLPRTHIVPEFTIRHLHCRTGLTPQRFLLQWEF